MSEYFASLNSEGKDRYQDKLELLKLTLKEDPLDIENEKNFVCDMTLWPPLEYGHIFCYFIERPGVYLLSCVIVLSDTQPPQHSDRKHIVPQGVMPIKNLIVLCFL